MKLWEYEDKRVKVTGVSGRVITGIADHYTSELDNPDGVATLSIDPCNGERYYVEFTEAEIACIEILPADAPTLQQAV